MLRIRYRNTHKFAGKIHVPCCLSLFIVAEIMKIQILQNSQRLTGKWDNKIEKRKNQMLCVISEDMPYLLHSSFRKSLFESKGILSASPFSKSFCVRSSIVWSPSWSPLSWPARSPSLYSFCRSSSNRIYFAPIFGFLWCLLPVGEYDGWHSHLVLPHILLCYFPHIPENVSDL